MDQTGWTQGQPPVQDKPFDQESPFEEPEQAPELREKRSENLYSRDEPFWNRVVDMPKAGEKPRRDPNYWNHPDVMDTDRVLTIDNDTLAVKFRKFLGSFAVRRFLLIFAVLLLVFYLTYSAVFQIRMINVTGNSAFTAEQIIRLSGLKVGQSSMSIDDDAVMRRIEGNRYLRCTLVDVQWDSVTIHVKERYPAAYIKHNGMLVTMDNRGVVLEEYLDTDLDLSGLVLVEGLDVRRASLGLAISLNKASQLDVYTQILVELKAMKSLDLLQELDLTAMDSIYLRTRDGYSVRLGNEFYIHEKLRAFLITRDKLQEMNLTQGDIDVTDPGRPTYRKPE